MAAKVTTLFNAVSIDSAGNAQRQGGFSETWYTMSEITSSGFLAAWNNLLRTRAALMPKNVSIVGQRIQTVDPLGPARSYEYQYRGSSTIQNDVPQMALLYQMNSAFGFNRRPVCIRGIPDARVTTGEYSGSDDFNSALVAYLVEVQNNWLMRAVDRTQPKFRVRTINTDNALGALVTTNAPHGYIVGDQVRIFSTLTSAGKKRTFVGKVTSAPTTTTFTLAPDGELDWGLSTGGFCRKEIYSYVGVRINLPEIQTPQVVVRKVGRPFHQYRGRQTARR